jgi:very-short-patch-repair endonuclease
MKHHPPDGAVVRARRLRKDMTDAERKLWRMLRESFGEHHFRRQVPIRHFIADFASHRAKLVIQVDGGQHNAAADQPRTVVIQQEGYRVLRFWNNEVLGNPDGVWIVIDAAVRDCHPTSNPSPSRGGESTNAAVHREGG